jgi:hypothetical protein
MGNQLYHHAWGIDLSKSGAPLLEGQVSYGKGQILFRDYVKTEDIFTVILEMCKDAHVGRVKLEVPFIFIAKKSLEEDFHVHELLRKQRMIH